RFLERHSFAAHAVLRCQADQVSEFRESAIPLMLSLPQGVFKQRIEIIITQGIRGVQALQELLTALDVRHARIFGPAILVGIVGKLDNLPARGSYSDGIQQVVKNQGSRDPLAEEHVEVLHNEDTQYAIIENLGD